MRELNLKQYLLGLLPEPAQTQLELTLLSDDEAYQQLLWAEDDLIEAYLQDELSAHERERFERIFLAHPERQQKLKLTQALITRANKIVTSESPKVISPDATKWWERFWPPDWKLVATTVLALLALTIGIRFVRQQSAPIESPIVTASPHSSEPPQPTAAPPVGTKTFSATLQSGTVMAAGTNIQEITLTPEYKEVRLQLGLRKDQWDTYHVTLKPDDFPAKEIVGEFKRKTLKGASYIEVTIPAADLQPGEFTLKLAGVNADGESGRADSYRLKVKRQ